MSTHEEFLTRREVGALLRISVGSVDALVRRGELPEPIRINQRVLRWPAAPVYAWRARLVAEAQKS